MDLQQIVGYSLICIGLFLWFWGTLPMLNKSHLLIYKLHTLTVSDTVGSLIMVFGFLVLSPSHWPIFTVVTISLVLWNTIFSYLLGVITERT